MRRIEVNSSVEELQARFQGGIRDPEILREMLELLSGQQSQRASDLRGKVIARLAELHAPALETAQGQSVGMRPPGAPGLPPPIVQQVGRRSELKLTPGATPAQKYLAALHALIDELKASNKRRARLLTHGRQLSGGGPSQLYSFEIDNSAGLLDDCDVAIEVDRVRHDAVIASVRPDSVLVSIATNLGREVPRARLLLDDTALLVQLCERIGDIGKDFPFNAALADAIVDPAPRLAAISALADSPSTARLDNSQQRARESVRTRPLTYIWGPPGCGKTYTLAEIVRMAFEANQRILICSNTNKAVDQLLYRVCEQLKGVDQGAALAVGQVIRLGQIVDDLLRADFADDISVDAITERIGKQMRECISQNQLELQQVLAQSRTVAEWVARFDELRDKQRTCADLSRALQILAEERSRLDEAIRALLQTLTQLHAELQSAERFLGRFLHRRKEQIAADIERAKSSLAAHRDKLDDTHRRQQRIARQHLEAEHEYRQFAANLARFDETKLRHELAELKQTEQSISELIRDLEQRIAHLQKEAIRNARIIGVTGTRAYQSARDLSPVDLVIIDEASMLLLPIVWFIAGMANTRVVVCGDFRQLPPIVGTDNPAVEEIIGTDVFNAAGVSQLDPNDWRIVMLNTQRRMQPAICKLISGPMYAGRLRTFNNAEFWAHRDAQPKPPEPLSATLTIVDTSELHPIESVDANHSRFNLLHALVTRNIAWLMQRREYLVDTKRLAIITPYRAQVNLTRTLLTDAEIEHAQVGTVHAFQGDERHTIVVDIPESAGPIGQAGRLIRGPAPDDIGARLINVAVSRAQNHLIIVANLTHLDRVLPASSMLREVLWTMQTEGTVVRAAELMSRGPAELDGLDSVHLKALAREYGLFDQADFDGAFAVDIGRARQSIAIFSGFIGRKRTHELAGALAARIQEGVKARCVTRPPRNNLPNTNTGKAALDKLEAIGCVVDCRNRIHQKVAIIDGHIVWHGSLNPMSYSQYSDELMTRTLGRGFARSVAALLAKKRVALEKVLEVITDAENPRCGQCGQSVRTFIDRKYNTEYFICENLCGWSEPLSGEPKHSAPPSAIGASVATADESSACSLCGAPMVDRNGRYGPFRGCSNYPRCKGKARSTTQETHNSRATRNLR